MNDSPPPWFSVVIPTHNRLPMLIKVLDALGVQKDSPLFEVVVIDDGSKDETAARIASEAAADRWRYPFTFRSQPNGGPGKARNHGVSLATGRFVVFIGDDTVPEPQFLYEHHRAHLKSGD